EQGGRVEPVEPDGPPEFPLDDLDRRGAEGQVDGAPGPQQHLQQADAVGRPAGAGQGEDEVGRGHDSPGRPGLIPRYCRPRVRGWRGPALPRYPSPEAADGRTASHDPEPCRTPSACCTRSAGRPPPSGTPPAAAAASWTCRTSTRCWRPATCTATSRT